LAAAFSLKSATAELITRVAKQHRVREMSIPVPWQVGERHENLTADSRCEVSTSATGNLGRAARLGLHAII